METISQATQESVWAALLETNRILTEKFAESDRIRKENERFLNEKFAETDRQLTRTDRQITKLGKMIGGVSKNHGSFAEEYFINSFKRGQNNFFGERFDKLLKFEMIKDKNKTKAEYDILLVNGKSVAIIEVKFKVHDKDVEKVTKKIKPFREKFPEYKNHSLYLGLASMVFDEKVENDCKANGIAVIKQVGETVVVNDDNLKSFF